LGRKNDAKLFFESRGYECKNHTIDIVKYDGRQLIWYDTKANRKKGIYAMNRDISLQNWIFKMNKGAE
jgi:hypothetical protein